MTERRLHALHLTRRACVVGASMALAVGLAAGPVQAQEKFPSKPIQVCLLYNISEPTRPY
jgi:hypothetical protein